jgi:hypothetical protein
MSLIKCPECNNGVSDSAESCPHCGHPISTGIKCPNCKSKNTSKISTTSKMGSALLFGVFSNKMTKTYECHACKYKW